MCVLARDAFSLAFFFSSLPPIFSGKNTFHTLGFLSDVLAGAWEVDCGSAVMMTSLLLRKLLPPLLRPFQHLPSNNWRRVQTKAKQLD